MSAAFTVPPDVNPAGIACSSSDGLYSNSPLLGTFPSIFWLFTYAVVHSIISLDVAVASLVSTASKPPSTSKIVTPFFMFSGFN